MSLSFYLPTIHLKLFHFLQVGFFILVDISKVYVMLYPTSQSSPAFHSIFNKKKTSAEIATKLNFISSIWDDYHIWRLDEKNWQCLWCNQRFQGINATKDLAHVLRKKGMNIKSCYVAKDKSHTTIYQELHHYKQTRKGVLLDYSENIRASITSLQNKSSDAIESTIHRSSKSVTSSNDTNSSVISGLYSASNISYDSNSSIFQIVHLFLLLMEILKN